jgi:hypothetical protein
LPNRIKPLFIIFGVIFFFAISCKKTEPPITYLKQPDYKYIDKLHISGDELWVISSSTNSLMSFFPILPQSQISVINMLNDQFSVNNKMPSIATFDLDKNQTPYLATYDKRVLKVNKDLSYE